MKETKPTNTLAIGVAISLIIAAACGGAYFLIFKGVKEVAGATKDGAIEIVQTGADLLNKAGKDIYRALQFEPKVTIGGETVYEPATQITEITTATKKFSHTYDYEVSWGGSTKRLKLRGEFTAKAGFPVNDSFTLEIAKDGQEVTLHHSEPELLSCELTKIQVKEDTDGWWNKIQPKERESAQNELLRRARARALDDDLRNEATQNLLERLAPLQNQYSFETKSEIIP